MRINCTDERGDFHEIGTGADDGDDLHMVVRLVEPVFKLARSWEVGIASLRSQ